MSTAAIRRYWDAIVDMGCVICGGPAEIAHAHGGSITLRMQEPKAKGKKLPRMDWICLPLCVWHHRDTSPCGLDRNVAEWEFVYGDQAMWIDRISSKLGVDVWAKAKEGKK